MSYASSMPLSTLWLANTDADTSVPPDWLSKQLRMADAGAVTSGRLRGRARGGFADTLRRQLPIHSTPMLEQGAP